MTKRKYTVAFRPARFCEDDAVATDYLARTVLELDNEPVDTGLLSSTGHPIYATQEPTPIGYVRFGWRS